MRPAATATLSSEQLLSQPSGLAVRASLQIGFDTVEKMHCHGGSHHRPNAPKILQILMLSQLAIVTNCTDINALSHQHQGIERSVQPSDGRIVVECRRDLPAKLVCSSLAFSGGDFFMSKSQTLDARFLKAPEHQINSHCYRAARYQSACCCGRADIHTVAATRPSTVRRDVEACSKLDSRPSSEIFSKRISLAPESNFARRSTSQALPTVRLAGSGNGPVRQHRLHWSAFGPRDLLKIPLCGLRFDSGTSSTRSSRQSSHALSRKGVKSFSDGTSRQHIKMAKTTAPKHDRQKQDGRKQEDRKRGLERRIAQAWEDWERSKSHYGRSTKLPNERLLAAPDNNSGEGYVLHEHWKSPLLETGTSMTITVHKGGGLDGGFRSIQQAIDSIPEHNTRRVIIRIQPGIYREKIFIPYKKPFITFQGDENGGTIITWSDTASTAENHTQKDAQAFKGSALFGTMQSASVTILSDGFIARSIIFENSAPAPEPGAVGAQAVALLIGGDRAAFYHCRFLGAQDTLYDYIGRHYYLNCYIQGSIDFVFGSGRSLFQACELHSIATSYGAIAAHQRQSPVDGTGFSFHQCTITGSGMLYLGRAWSPYARIVFSRCYFDNIIFPEGWSDFGHPQRQSTAFFGQYECRGPGANLSERAHWSKLLNESEVIPYLSVNFINGDEWLNPATEPFTPLQNMSGP